MLGCNPGSSPGTCNVPQTWAALAGAARFLGSLTCRYKICIWTQLTPGHLPKRPRPPRKPRGIVCCRGAGWRGGSLEHLRICPSRSPHKIHLGLHSFSSATHGKTKFPSFKLRQREHSVPYTRALTWLGCHWVSLELPAQALGRAVPRVHSGDTQQRFPFLEGLPHHRAKKVGFFFFF